MLQNKSLLFCRIIIVSIVQQKSDLVLEDLDQVEGTGTKDKEKQPSIGTFCIRVFVLLSFLVLACICVITADYSENILTVLITVITVNQGYSS